MSRAFALSSQHREPDAQRASEPASDAGRAAIIQGEWTGMKGPGDSEFKGTKRFKVVRCLGEGGMGVVYEAIDQENGSRAALKTLRYMSGDALLRFKNEFRALQDLEHPNLVSLGELFEEQGHWFFTMELVRGVNFIQHVRPKAEPRTVSGMEETDLAHSATMDSGATPPAPLAPPLPRQPPASAEFDEPRLRDAMRQLSIALFSLHEAEMVHRDIKPSNVLVEGDGRVVVLDFGLVTGVATVDQSMSMHVVGTVEYMAPEQAATKPVGPEADWYAVGVMLYESLTGRLPLTGAPLQVMINKQKFDPPPPRSLLPDLPSDLDTLCTELLRFDPRARPRGDEVLARLGAQQSEAPSRAASTSSRHRLFVGRQQELRFLEQAFKDSQQGKALAMLVQGESGVGKTALVSNFTRGLRASDQGVVILSGRCYERESVPYKAMDGVVDSLSLYMSSLPHEEAAALLPRSAALLGDIFPVLRRIKSVANAPRIHDETQIDPQELRTRLFNAVRELLMRLADRHPVVIIVDDLQWADTDSLALIAEVLRPPEAPAVLVIATQRSSKDAPGEGAIFHKGPAFMGEVRELLIKRLPPQDARELAYLFAKRSPTMADIKTDAIASEAAGHPLFIQELLHHAEVHGDHGAEVLRLDDVLWTRVLELPPDIRKVLELVAVAGTPIPQEVVAQASSIAPADFQRCLAQLRVGNLVQTAGPRGSDEIHAYHDRVREALVGHLEEGVRVSYHRELALALEALGNADPELLGVHWREAEERERAAAYTIRAASAAVAALAFDHAARLYQVVLDLRPADHESAHQLRVQMADALANAGRGAEAAESFLQAAEGATTAEALNLQQRAAEQFLRSGYADRGLATIHSVLAAVGTSLPRTPGRALASLLYRRALIRLRGTKFRERHESQISAEELARIDAYLSVASTLAVIDNIRGCDFNGRTLLMALKAGEPNRLMRALALETIYSALGGSSSRRRTEKLLQVSRDLAQRIDEPRAHGWARAADGIYHYYGGQDFNKALKHCRAAETLFRDKSTGMAWEAATMRLYRLFSMIYAGQISEISRIVPQYLAEALDRGDLYNAINLRIGLTNVAWLVRDNSEEAARLAREGSALLRREGIQVQHWDMQAYGHVGLYQGKAKETFQQYLDDWPSLVNSQLLRIQLTRIEAYQFRARCALAVAAGEDASEQRRLWKAAKKDARKILREKVPIAPPLAGIVMAGLAASMGDLDQAKEQLDAAASGFDAVKMPLHAAIARRQQGRLLGGDEGRALLEQADAWMKSQQIKAPERWSAMLAPGFPD